MSGDKTLEKASMNELAEEMVDSLLAAAHYETMGDASSRILHRQNAITIINEMVSRKIHITTSSVISGGDNGEEMP